MRIICRFAQKSAQSHKKQDLFRISSDMDEDTINDLTYLSINGRGDGIDDCQ
jgi:hypothetical protein